MSGGRLVVAQSPEMNNGLRFQDSEQGELRVKPGMTVGTGMTLMCSHGNIFLASDRNERNGDRLKRV